MFLDSEVEIYYDLLKNDQILLQCTETGWLAAGALAIFELRRQSKQATLSTSLLKYTTTLITVVGRDRPK
jgi:hypothetical protein